MCVLPRSYSRNSGKLCTEFGGGGVPLLPPGGGFQNIANPLFEQTVQNNVLEVFTGRTAKIQFSNKGYSIDFVCPRTEK